MKARELRIGNYVVYPNYNKDGSDRNWLVRDLFFDGYEIGLTNGKIQTLVSFDSIKPIPLTEEWLLRIGFSKIGLNYSLMIDGFEFIIWTKLQEFQPIGLCYKNSFDIDIKIESVHQLQNLYFALTGEELTIKN